MGVCLFGRGLEVWGVKKRRAARALRFRRDQFAPNFDDAAARDGTRSRPSDATNKWSTPHSCDSARMARSSMSGERPARLRAVEERGTPAPERKLSARTSQRSWKLSNRGGREKMQICMFREPTPPAVCTCRHERSLMQPRCERKACPSWSSASSREKSPCRCPPRSASQPGLLRIARQSDVFVNRVLFRRSGAAATEMLPGRRRRRTGRCPSSVR